MLKIRKALDRWYDWYMDGLDRWYRWCLDGNLWRLTAGLLVLAVVMVILLALILVTEIISIGVVLTFLVADFALGVWANCWEQIRRREDDGG